jgi:hypothetical protein
MSNLTEAVERDIQQLQIDARKQLAQGEAGESGKTSKLTLIEARRQRCRQARYQLSIFLIRKTLREFAKVGA